MDKRGLSDVVTTVLIVLLSIVAVAIVSAVIVKTLQKESGKVGTFGDCNTLDLAPRQCVFQGTNVLLSIKRGPASAGQPLSNITLVFKKSDGTTIKANAPIIPAALETVQEGVVLSDSPASVSLVGILLDSETGKTKTCPASVEIKCESGRINTVCSNGVVEVGESCGEPGLSCTAGRTCSSCTCVNTPPVVSLTSPVNNANFNPPASINLVASASDASGSVSRVEFYRTSNGTQLLNTDTNGANGWSYQWNSVPLGTYTFIARAIDNEGASTDSASVSVSVGLVSNVPPTFRMVTPLTSGIQEYAPTTAIPFMFNITDPNGDTLLEYSLYVAIPGSITDPIHGFTPSNLGGTVLPNGARVFIFNEPTFTMEDLYSVGYLTASNDTVVYVRARDSFGNVAVSPNMTLRLSTRPPAAPTTPLVYPLTKTTMQVSWNDRSANEQGFRVWRATSAVGPWTNVVTLPAGTISYQDSGLTPNTMYYYNISAYNTYGQNFSRPVSSARTYQYSFTISNNNPNNFLFREDEFEKIYCGTSCTGYYFAGDTFTLVATTPQGAPVANFGWGNLNQCSPSSSTCEIAMIQDFSTPLPD